MRGPVHLSKLTPLAFLERSAAVFPDRVAVIDGDRRVTNAQLAWRVQRFAVGLQALGLVKDDRVGVLAPNVFELLEAHYAVPAAGCLLVALNTRLARDEIAQILGHAGVRVLVVHPTLADRVPADLGEVRVITCGAEYEAFISAAPDPAPGAVTRCVR